ncbi:MAG: pyruvate kinase [Planctomycetota bacterium]
MTNTMTTMPKLTPNHDAEPLGVTRPTLTKIVATLGPASASATMVERLIAAGVAVFRFNFSHGTLDEHREALDIVRRASREAGRPVAVLGDLQGPKIRVGTMVDGGVEIEPGTRVIIQREPIVGEPPTAGRPLRISSTYDGLLNDVEVGQRVLLADGALRMLVVDKTADELHCTVTNGGLLTSKKGINLPESELSVDPITERDWACVDWAVEHQIDCLALSFVRRAADVSRLADGIRERMRTHGRGEQRMPIIAKIELPTAVRDIESILDVSQAIMVARGDLGVEMDFAVLPVVQKELIAAARDHGKPVIVATQMLESMIDNPAPTRAEATDVANAILDDADAVMLSGETAVGAHPGLVVEQMRRIAAYTEEHQARAGLVAAPPKRLLDRCDRAAATAHGVATIVSDVQARFVFVWSENGRMARMLSQNHFRIPVIAATADSRAARQMQFLRGVTPVRMSRPSSLAEFTRLVDAYLIHSGWAEPGETCVLVAAWPLSDEDRNHHIALHDVGDPEGGFATL